MKVALIQESPVLFHLSHTLEKMDQLMRQASSEKPDLIMFPEAFIPGYPRALSFGTTIGSRTNLGRELFAEYARNSIFDTGDEVRFLGNLAKLYSVYLVIGITESTVSGTLYCTMLYFDPLGNLMGKHRKMKPTGAERIIWGEGDGQDLEVFDTPFGKLGGLICWENYMPLARTWLYEQGIQLYLAPTADNREGWQHTLKHIALEGRCFVLACNQFVKMEEYPLWVLKNEHLSELPEFVSAGGSVIIDPFGEEVVAPLWNQAGIIHAELDLSLLTKAKLDFDAVGHYARNDIFQLHKK